MWPDLAAVGAQWSEERSFTPAPDRTAADAGYAMWQRAVERSRDWATT